MKLSKATMKAKKAGVKPQTVFFIAFTLLLMGITLSLQWNASDDAITGMSVWDWFKGIFTREQNLGGMADATAEQLKACITFDSDEKDVFVKLKDDCPVNELDIRYKVLINGQYTGDNRFSGGTDYRVRKERTKLSYPPLEDVQSIQIEVIMMAGSVVLQPPLRSEVFRFKIANPQNQPNAQELASYIRFYQEFTKPERKVMVQLDGSSPLDEVTIGYKRMRNELTLDEDTIKYFTVTKKERKTIILSKDETTIQLQVEIVKVNGFELTPSIKSAAFEFPTTEQTPTTGTVANKQESDEDDVLALLLSDDSTDDDTPSAQATKAITQEDTTTTNELPRAQKAGFISVKTGEITPSEDALITPAVATGKMLKDISDEESLGACHSLDIASKYSQEEAELMCKCYSKGHNSKKATKYLIAMKYKIFVPYYNLDEAYCSGALLTDIVIDDKYGKIVEYMNRYCPVETKGDFIAYLSEGAKCVTKSEAQGAKGITDYGFQAIKNFDEEITKDSKSYANQIIISIPSDQEKRIVWGGTFFIHVRTGENIMMEDIEVKGAMQMIPNGNIKTAQANILPSSEVTGGIRLDVEPSSNIVRLEVTLPQKPDWIGDEPDIKYKLKIPFVVTQRRIPVTVEKVINVKSSCAKDDYQCHIIINQNIEIVGQKGSDKQQVTGGSSQQATTSKAVFSVKIDGKDAYDGKSFTTDKESITVEAKQVSGSNIGLFYIRLVEKKGSSVSTTISEGTGASVTLKGIKTGSSYEVVVMAYSSQSDYTNKKWESAIASSRIPVGKGDSAAVAKADDDALRAELKKMGVSPTDIDRLMKMSDDELIKEKGKNSKLAKAIDKILEFRKKAAEEERNRPDGTYEWTDARGKTHICTFKDGEWDESCKRDIPPNNAQSMRRVFKDGTKVDTDIIDNNALELLQRIEELYNDMVKEQNSLTYSKSKGEFKAAVKRNAARKQAIDDYVRQLEKIKEKSKEAAERNERTISQKEGHLTNDDSTKNMPAPPPEKPSKTDSEQVQGTLI
ncbi:hypothetical protein JXA85_05490 [Candidatus Woesearchaeota archaeon]|nr:hypothetical protein [Candidatus Woesearchaeota archaeon]